MLKNCPDPIDVQDIHFKLHCRLKVFENKDLKTFNIPHNLVTCASRYGLLFVGTNTSNLQAIQLSSLENYSPKDKDILDYPYRDITLPSIPRHVSVNCDSTILAVVVEQDQCPVAIFYDVLSFFKQTVQTLNTLRLSTNPSTYVTEINWNPALPALFTACKSDGSLGIFELKGSSVEINEIPSGAEVSSFCWSPKGKQIAVGSKKGTITQYKPDLKAVRMINAPNLTESTCLISLQWISNYQFIGVYQPIAADAQAKLLVVDAPKTGEPTYTNYDDICYSGSSRKPQFLMLFQQQWNILMVASSNSAELAVVGQSSPDSWTQWIISDSSRPELPLSVEKQETFPIGLSFDVSNSKPYPWGESTIAPCPYVLMLSHHGILCIFNLVNLKNVPAICTPPDLIQDMSGINLFVAKSTVQKEEMAPAQFIQTGQQITTAVSSQPNLINFSMSTPQQTSNTTQSIPLFMVQPQAGLKQIQQPQSEISITPIAKAGQPQANSKTHTDDTKYGSIFSVLNTPQPSTTLPVQVKPIVISAPNKTTVEKKALYTIEPPVSSTFATTGKAKSDLAATTKASSDAQKIDTEAILQKMIKEECVCLENELKAVLQKGRMINIDVGSEAEKMDMLKTIEHLEEFCKEISEISLGEKSEIHILKQNLVLSWAWFEEALSRYNSSKDEMMHLLIKSQPLDSATEKTYNDINKLLYYIESQLIQVGKALDEQWDKFQDYVKKTYRVQTPTMEAIYQAMVRQNAVLQKQSYMIQDISNQLKQQKRRTSSCSASLLLSIENVQLENELKRLQLNSNARYNEEFNPEIIQTKQLSDVKSRKLHLLLKNRDVAHVTFVKPFVPTESYQSPSKRLSLLGAKMSPVPKLIEPKQIDISQHPSFNPISFNSTHIVAPTKPLNFVPVDKTPSPVPVTKSVSLMGIKGTQLLPGTLPSAFVPAVVKPQKSVVTSSNTFINIPKTTETTTTIKPFSSIAFASPPISSPITVSSVVTTATAVSSSLNLTTKTTSSLLGSQSTLAFSFSSFGGTSATTVTTNVSPSAITAPKVTPVSSKVLTSSVTNNPVTSSISKFSDQTSSSSGSVVTTSGSIFGGFLLNTKTTTGSTSSLFGSTSVSSNPIFAQSSPSITSSTSSIFGTTKNTSLFGNTTTTTTPTNLFSNLAKTDNSSSSSTTQTSVFAQSTGVTTAKKLFGVAATTTQGSLGSAATQASFFGSNTTPKKQPSIFGSATPTTQGSIFGSTPTTTTQASIFGSVTTQATQASVFGPVKTTPIQAPAFGSITTPTSQISVFGTPSTPTTQTSDFGLLASSTTQTSSFEPAATPTTQTAVFGSASTPTTQGSAFGPVATPTTQTSIFGPTAILTTQTSAFGTTSTSTTQSSAFGLVATPTTQTSVFGSASTPTTQVSTFGLAATPPTQASAFGPATTPTTQTSIFGPAATTTYQTSIFGSAATPTTQTSIFESAATPTTQASIFGSAATPTTQAPIFGSVAAPANQTSVFGSATTSTTQTSIFRPTTTPTTQPSIFGAVSAPTSQTSIFATSATPVTQSSMFGGTTGMGSIFGSPAATTSQGSIFGTPAATTATQGSIFGSSTTTATTQSSIFGSGNSTTPTFGSPFGSTTGQSVFSATTTSTTSPFGQPTSSSFGSNFGTASTGFTSTSALPYGPQGSTTFGSSGGSIFGSSASGSSTFGAVSSSGSVFGSPAVSSSFSFASTSGENALSFGGLNVGTATTTSGGFVGGSTFGSTLTQSNPFGRAPEMSSFGGGGSPFGTPSSTATSIFGGGNSAFGTNSQSTNFGSSFGTPGFEQQQQSAFSQSTFGSPSFGSTQPGPFSGGGVGVGQSGFGSPTAFQKPPSGFGGAPVFGGSPAPAFGGSPSFGGSPAFGAAPSFGSPTKVFGSNTAAVAFGSSTGVGASQGFGNLANQNTIGFGNLAKQASNAQPTGFSGNSSFSSWR